MTSNPFASIGQPRRGSGPEPVSSDTAAQDFLGFTDLEQELLGREGADAAKQALQRLSDFEARLGSLEKQGLSQAQHKAVASLREAIAAGRKILAAPHLSARKKSGFR